MDDLKEITTEPIDLRGLADSMERDVPLAWAGSFITFAPDHVRVTATFEEVIVAREFKNVLVRVLHAEEVRGQVSPGSIDVTVRGPQRLLHNYKIPDGAVTADAAGLSAGPHRVPAEVELPPPLEVIARKPDMVLLQIGPRGAH